ncbi:MAG: hypothetical protein LBP50_03385 [Tannerella sp.]|nr:hypothetical protein [Tannerella sp.]
MKKKNFEDMKIFGDPDWFIIGGLFGNASGCIALPVILKPDSSGDTVLVMLTGGIMGAVAPFLAALSLYPVRLLITCQGIKNEIRRIKKESRKGVRQKHSKKYFYRALDTILDENDMRRALREETASDDKDPLLAWIRNTIANKPGLKILACGTCNTASHQAMNVNEICPACGIRRIREVITRYRGCSYCNYTGIVEHYSSLSGEGGSWEESCPYCSNDVYEEEVYYLEEPDGARTLLL